MTHEPMAPDAEVRSALYWHDPLAGLPRTPKPTPRPPRAHPTCERCLGTWLVQAWLLGMVLGFAGATMFWLALLQIWRR